MALVESFSGIRGIYGKDLTNEIAVKYPNTKYGKQAIQALKEEIPKLKAEIKNK